MGLRGSPRVEVIQVRLSKDNLWAWEFPIYLNQWFEWIQVKNEVGFVGYKIKKCCLQIFSSISFFNFRFCSLWEYPTLSMIWIKNHPNLNRYSNSRRAERRRDWSPRWVARGCESPTRRRTLGHRPPRRRGCSTCPPRPRPGSASRRVFMTAYSRNRMLSSILCQRIDTTLHAGLNSWPTFTHGLIFYWYFYMATS